MGTGWFSSPASSEREPFKVVIHAGELAQIKKWVARHPNIETGGDLFGLWSKKNTVIVQFVLGPGAKSKRTSVSFFQDSEYLKKAGSAITEGYGLCHIGEWHSHHSLGLPTPSGGDQSTVRSNMPNYGWKRFVVFIANIDKSEYKPRFGLGCFLFEAEDTTKWKQLEMLQGEFVVIPKQSPLRLFALQDASLRKRVEKGAESINEVGVVSEENGFLMDENDSRPQGKGRQHSLRAGEKRGRLHKDQVDLIKMLAKRLKGRVIENEDARKVVLKFGETPESGHVMMEFGLGETLSLDDCFWKIPIDIPDGFVFKQDKIDETAEKIRQMASAQEGEKITTV